jgi:hypothetical protein
MSTANISAAVLVILGLSVTIERLIEMAWISIQAAMARNSIINSDFLVTNAPKAATWSIMKTLLSIPLGIGLGIAASFVTSVHVGFNSNPTYDMLISGSLAGFFAPFAHQLIQFFLQAQQYLSANSPASAVAAAIAANNAPTSLALKRRLDVGNIV